MIVIHKHTFMTEIGHHSSHLEVLRSISDELMTDYGFTAADLRETPVTFDVMRAVIDSGDPPETWAFAWHLTGNNLHLPPDMWFEGTEARPGLVPEEDLAHLGEVAAMEEVQLDLQPAYVRLPGVELSLE